MTTHFCNRLKNIREDNDVTQADAAHILNVTRSAYGRYERGDREPPLSFITDFCRHFHVSADYLLGLTDTPSITAPLIIAPTSTPRDPFSDLTHEQRITIEASLKAYRELNAASKEA